MTLLITGAGGQLGRRTAELLLDRDDRPELILVTRQPDAIADLAGRGATVRFGDFDDPTSLPAAFAGAERMLLISTTEVGDKRVAEHRAAIDAAVAAGVHHVVYTSCTNPTAANPALVVPDHRTTEDHLAGSGLGWTFLRHQTYAELQIPDGDPHRLPEGKAAFETGVLRTNHGDGETAYVSREDCAAVAAVVLSGGEEYACRAYDVTGPELIGAARLAELYARLGDRPVTVEEVTDAQYVDGLVAAGLPGSIAGLLASFGSATRLGAFAVLSSTVEDLTGQVPRTMSAVLEEALAPAAS
ncbi:MAG: NAD(P)H-binding protein [Solirubrobacterales bacterium]